MVWAFRGGAVNSTLRILGLWTRAQLLHGQPRTFYDIQLCEAPQQPSVRREGLSNVNNALWQPLLPATASTPVAPRYTSIDHELRAHFVNGLVV